MNHLLGKKFYACALTVCLYTGISAVHGVITVTNTNNSGAGSLRQAILDANADPYAPHDIVFAIGSGVQTIQPTSELPAIVANYTLIDGTSQPGWSLGNPQIVIDGSLLTPYTVHGLTINGAHNCALQGLVINNGFDSGIMITDASVGAHGNVITQCFIGIDQTGTSARPNNYGITIQGSTDYPSTSNVIGGFNATLGNVISGNIHYGIYLVTNVQDTSIHFNYIGTDVTGTAAIPNDTGIVLLGSLIPLATEQAIDNVMIANVISGNTTNGIHLKTNSFVNSMFNNLIGVDATGIAPLPNNVGILFEGSVSIDPANGPVSENLIGDGNVISCNTTHGIVFKTNSTNNHVFNSFIGTDLTHTLNLGNGGNGVLIQGTTDAPCNSNYFGLQGPNVIAYNAGYGALLNGDATTPDIHNPFVENAMYNNGNNAIALTNNGNNLQSTPLIINAVLNADGWNVMVEATAPLIPSFSYYRIDFYLNDVDNSPITEGKTLLGYVDQVPSGVTIVHLLPLPTQLTSNLWISATATILNNAGGLPGDTSPHSPNIQMDTLPNNIPLYMFQF